MPFLMCHACSLAVTMKRLDAKAHGWTVKDIPIPNSVEEVWTCPRCNDKREAVA